nr:putative ribonuclease H-like domain-containing protein [Tanacetum cinerariifolium]
MVQKPVWNSAMRVNHQTSVRMTHPHSNRNVVPIAILTRSRLVSLNAARPVPTTITQSNMKSTWLVKHVVNMAHSPIRRPIKQRTATKNSNFNQKVTTVKVNKVNAVQGNKGNAEKASAYWMWKPKCKVLGHGNPQQALRDKGVIDSGFPRHMTGNISFLLEFEEINGGYVAFGGNPKGGKISGKGKIKTQKLDFGDVYFVKELNFNLFSVSEMVPRENNMYNVNLKNAVPSGATKDETIEILKTFITDIENQINHKVKIIRWDNETKFKNHDMNQFCAMKGIKRDFSVARTPQENGVLEKKNRTLIEAAKNMLADSLLPIPFWPKAVNTAYYVQNRVFVSKPYNKTPYELLLGRSPSIGFIRPFGCLVTILNTLDPLAKFDGKADEGFLVGYSVNCKVGKKTVSAQQYVLLPLWSTSLQEPQNTDDDVAFDVKENENDVYVSTNGSDKTDNRKHDENAKRDDKGKSHVDLLTGVRDLRAEFEEFSFNSSNKVNAVSAPVNAAGPNPNNNTNNFNTASPSVNAVSPNFRIAGKSSFVDSSKYPNDPDMPELEDIVYSNDKEDVGADADLSNLETNIHVNPIPTTRVHKDHLVNQIISDLNSAPQTRSMTRMMDVKSAFLYGTIKEDVYVFQPPGFEDLDYPDKVYTVVKALYGLHQDSRAWYLKGKPHLGLWYPRDSPFNMVAYSDSDYARASLDRKSTTGGCQFLGCRLISWKCKKQTVIATSSTKAEYVAAASCLLIDAQQISNESPLLGVNTPRCDEDSIELKELMVFMAMATVKKVNDDVQLRTLIDGKKVVVSEAIIRRDLHLDDADGVECLPNDEIFEELARMRYEKPPPKLTFYKAFFSAQWKFLIHTLVQCLSAKRTAWNEFSCSMASAIICIATGRKFNFSKYIFDSMVRNVDSPSVEIPISPAPPSTTSAPSPTDLQDTTPTPHATPPQDQPPTLHDSPPQDEPTTPHESSMPLLTILMETYATLSQKVAKLEKDKHSQALEILQLKKRVKRLERKKNSNSRRMHPNRGEITVVDADEGITLVDVETDEEIIRVRGITEAYQNFEDMLKGFDREDLVTLWNLVKEKFSSAVLSEDKEKAL